MAGLYTQNYIQPQQKVFNTNVANQPVYNQPANVEQVQSNVVPTYKRSYNSNFLPAQWQFLTRPVKSQFAQPKVEVSNTANTTVAVNNIPLATQINAIPDVNGSKVPKFPFKNDLRQLMQENKVVMDAIVVRTFGAVDKDNSGFIEHSKNESGTFLNAINRLDELKTMGINTLHVLPINEVGKINKLGEAGSIYAPYDYLMIANELDTPNNGLSVKDEMKIFVNECHKRGLRVMIDLPSCGSIDMTKTQPELFLRDRDGNLKVPGSWKDIRMFDPFTNKDNGELRQPLFEMHKKFVDLMVEVGVDGIRADVARAKPAHFWKPLIEYSHQKDPGFAWFAESYVHEDASPMANIPADRPEELLKAGFDSYYGQWHILQSMKDATEVHKYVTDNIEMSYRLPAGKSMVGTYYTHDDKSIMNHGGALYCQFAATLLNTLPMLNTYFINGNETGDTKQMDIFNYVEAPKGNDPHIFQFYSDINKMRENNVDVIGKGHYIPLKVNSSEKDDQVMAFVRHLNGKSLLVLANKDINARHIGKVEIPTLKPTQELIDQVPQYGAKSRLAIQNSSVAFDLAPGRVHVFEIDTPNILGQVQEVYRQNL